MVRPRPPPAVPIEKAKPPAEEVSTSTKAGPPGASKLHASSAQPGPPSMTASGITHGRSGLRGSGSHFGRVARQARGRVLALEARVAELRRAGAQLQRIARVGQRPERDEAREVAGEEVRAQRGHRRVGHGELALQPLQLARGSKRPAARRAAASSASTSCATACGSSRSGNCNASRRSAASASG